MVTKFKTYMRRVFGGKDADWRGLDQGKSQLHKDGLHFSMNCVYDGNVFKHRAGQVIETMVVGGEFHNGKNNVGTVVITNSTDVFMEETV